MGISGERLQELGIHSFCTITDATRPRPGLPGRESYLFSYESLSKLNYPKIEQSFLPGHAGFPVLQFFRDDPDFDYYWLIEYDVRFSGD
jgi:hypothetical protein